jgi:hypothetical protein
MSRRDTTEYKIITDKIISPDPEQDILVFIPEGAMYKDSYEELDRYTTVTDLGLDTSFTVAGGSLGTQPTFNGAPLFTGSYVRTGPMVHFRIDVDFDNIESFGTGQYYLDLPFTSKYNYDFGSGCLHHISTGVDYTIRGHLYAGESRMLLKSTDNTGNSSFQIPFTYNQPIALSTADNFHIAGTYITAEFE